MEKAEADKAATRLGVEEKNPLRRIMKGVGIVAIVLAALLFIYFLFEQSRDTSTYPHVRSPYVPRNRFLALLLLNASEQVKYGVFSREELLVST